MPSQTEVEKKRT